MIRVDLMECYKVPMSGNFTIGKVYAVKGGDGYSLKIYNDKKNWEEFQDPLPCRFGTTMPNINNYFKETGYHKYLNNKKELNIYVNSLEV